MSDEVPENISFLELAKLVLQKAGQPMTADQIWQYAEQNDLTPPLRSKGRTPKRSLGARLYTDVRQPTSEFVKLGSGPARFWLKSRASSIPDLEQQVAAQPSRVVTQNTYERDLHPLLVWFAGVEFGAHCRTIFHERSQKTGAKQNQWIHPDVVGFSLATQDWEHEVVQLAQNSGALAARLYSFEVKISLDFTTLREFFFQAVSNSSWAHEGYLAAVEIDENPEFRAELTRLSQSFGIGVIQLNTSEPEDSEILLPAREKAEIDWTTVDRIAAVNRDFREFVNSVAKSVKINCPVVSGFDDLLTDAKLDEHLKRILKTPS